MEMENNKTQFASVDKDNDTATESRNSVSSGVRGSILQNSYAAKKTVAQGMMDIALIVANANQLRYVLEYNRQSDNFYFVIILLFISMILQVHFSIISFLNRRLT